MEEVVRIHALGGAEALTFEKLDVAPPGPGQALLRHTAIGVNFIDTYHRSGLYPLPSLPSGIGMEAAGVVEALGPGVTDLAEGDRVAYAAGPPGAYATARCIAADRLVRLPASIGDDTAAAAMLKGLTVEYLVRRTFPVQSGQTVLWHAAAGGVGLIACQWLRHLGVTVIGTVGSEDKGELARAHGCSHTILYREESFVARVRELTSGEGVPVVFDSVGRSTFADSLECLQPRGMMVSFGNASGKPEPFDIGALSTKGSLYLTRPALGDYTAERSALLEAADAVFDVISSGAVVVPARHSWPLAEAAEAHRALEARRTAGSVLLRP